MDVSREARAAISEAVTRLERDFYGRGPGLVKVSVSDSDPEVITVLSFDTLTAADRTLRERGDEKAVTAHHRALHEATAKDFCSAIETIVGRAPSSYLAQLDPSTALAVRVFVFVSDETSEILT